MKTKMYLYCYKIYDSTTFSRTFASNQSIFKIHHKSNNGTESEGFDLTFFFIMHRLVWNFGKDQNLYYAKWCFHSGGDCLFTSEVFYYILTRINRKLDSEQKIFNPFFVKLPNTFRVNTDRRYQFLIEKINVFNRFFAISMHCIKKLWWSIL